MNGLLPAGRPGVCCSFSGSAPRNLSWALDLPPRRTSGAASQKRVRRLDIAVKERGQLRLGERAHARRLDVAVLEEHQRRDAADAEFRRRELVLVHVQLGDLQASL